jgi:transcriptional regulator with XRE-family HTH domain
MITKKKSEAKAFLEDISGGPLTFGEMLHSIRQADEISQADLARKMKISRAMLCDIEKGRRPVSVERAKSFAQELGYSVTQFVAVAVEEQLRKSGFKAKIHLEAA